MENISEVITLDPHCSTRVNIGGNNFNGRVPHRYHPIIQSGQNEVASSAINIQNLTPYCTYNVPQMWLMQPPPQYVIVDTFENKFYKLLHNYLLGQDKLLPLGYPTVFSLQKRVEHHSNIKPFSFYSNIDANDKKIVSRNEHEATHTNHSIGSLKTCCRCRKEFIISADRYITDERCWYHWGKLQKVRNPANEMYVHRAYVCCQRKEGSLGCTEGRLHVWVGHVRGIIGPVDEFVVTQTRREPAAGIYPNVFALDCEMCFTVKGLELTKVTVVNVQGVSVYNAFVKPYHEIVDYNTRFSGISANDLNDGATKTIREVHDDLMCFIDADTILIGHGLENDLRALKMVHHKIVDTAHVFPHHMGLPFRRSLKDLAYAILNRTIQCSARGHDSYEDAHAIMELMLWRVTQDYGLL